MATSVLCPDCDKQVGIVSCIGCKQTFCVQHFQVHRQNLSAELEHVINRRNALHERYQSGCLDAFSSKTSDAWTSIDDWERQMNEQVKRRADETRQQLDRFTHDARNGVEQRFQQLTEQIQQNVEHENFLETDVERLNQQLDQIEESIQQNGYRLRVTLVCQPIDWNTSMQVKVSDGDTPKMGKAETVLPRAPLTSVATSKTKHPPSIQRKCHACGTDTWQRECRCCGNAYCGWHLKRHCAETKIKLERSFAR